MKHKHGYMKVSKAARLKGCSTQAIYNALDADPPRLNEHKMLDLRLVIDDRKFREWKPRAVNGVAA